MKKFRLFPLILIICIIFSAAAPAAFALDDPDIGAASVIIVDLNTGKIVYSLNPDEQRAPASLTKIMTVLLAVEAIEDGRVSLDDEVTAQDDCRNGLDDDSSTVNIMPGEVMTLKDLLYCALVHSANEACNVIATYISGSISAFVDDMNTRAAELGCTGTHFSNPHGLTAEDHYSTAADLSLITEEALKHDLFCTICNTVSYTVPATNMSDPRTLSNSNALISTEGVYGGSYKYSYAFGVKTGYTRAAGYCLISTAEKDDKHLMAVVLGCDGLLNSDSDEYGNFVDTITLYNWVFDNFSYQSILLSTDILTEVSVQYAENDETVGLRPASDVELLLPDDADLSLVDTELTVYEDRLVAPLEAGIPVGEVTVSYDGEVCGTVKLVTSKTVALAKSVYMQQRISEILHKSSVRAVIIILVVLIVLYIILVARYRHMRRMQLRERRRRRLEQERRRREAEERQSEEDDVSIDLSDTIPDTGRYDNQNH